MHLTNPYKARNLKELSVFVVARRVRHVVGGGEGWVGWAGTPFIIGLQRPSVVTVAIHVRHLLSSRIVLVRCR